MKTYVPKKGEVTKRWYVIDAADQVLGRVATEAAKIIRGKHKPQYTPYLDCGDHVIIVNAGKVKVTGKKALQKVYYRHSGYPGGIKEITLGKMMAKRPERAVLIAVKGMLPHNRLGRALAKHIRVYAGPAHRHAAQKPEPYQVRGR